MWTRESGCWSSKGTAAGQSVVLPVYAVDPVGIGMHVVDAQGLKDTKTYFSIVSAGGCWGEGEACMYVLETQGPQISV